MRRSNKRLFDAVLFVLGFALTVALFDEVLLHGATSRMLATTLLTWLMWSVPLAILIGHCALSEE
jgi:predicted membrane protein